MLYNNDPITDYNNILMHIDSFSKEMGATSIQIDTSVLMQVCFGIRERFPYVGGANAASVFKKAANFIAWFVELSPIKSKFVHLPLDGLQNYNINAVIAFDIAIICLENSSIHKNDGTIDTVDKPLYISDHSYVSIIEALSSCGAHKDSYHLLAVLLEQIVYKTNKHCEYQEDDNSPIPSYYPQTFPLHGDDLTGV